MDVPTVHTLLAGLADRANLAITELFKHSVIRNTPTQLIRGNPRPGMYGMMRPGEDGVVMGYSVWEDLPPQGIHAQAESLARYREFEEIARVLLKEQPEKTIKEFKSATLTITAAIQQTKSPPQATAAVVLTKMIKALETQLDLIRNLYDSCEGTTVLVPDTNALLYYPALEDWVFADIPCFTLILLPTILEELDGMKVGGRNETLRTKAEGLITRIKGYRARGSGQASLLDGVPLRKGVSQLKARALEPKMEDSLPWLDPSNQDDRFIAGFLEVMRSYPRSAVVLITLDVNLQNKAAFARLPFIEPPCPPQPTKPEQPT